MKWHYLRRGWLWWTVVLFCLCAFIWLKVWIKFRPMNPQDSVWAAIVDYEIGSFNTGLTFVSVDESATSRPFSSRGHDPSDDFLDHFWLRGPRVRPASQGIFKPGAFPPGQFVDKKTGEPGSLLVLGQVRWISPSEAQVYAGGMGVGERYTVTSTWRGWVVTGRPELAWIA